MVTYITVRSSDPSVAVLARFPDERNQSSQPAENRTSETESASEIRVERIVSHGGIQGVNCLFLFPSELGQGWIMDDCAAQSQSVLSLQPQRR